MSKKIMLDAGHYGYYNQSPAVKDYYESIAMWKLHLMLKSALEAHGFIVGTTRAEQTKDMEVYARGKAAAGYDLLISLHSNATTGVNETIDYPVAYVSINGKGNAIGDKLAKEVARIMGTKQAGRIATRKNDKGGDYYGITNGANAAGSVGIILEHSFHTQTAATKWLLSDDNLRKLAEAEAGVIAEHFGVKKAVTQTGPLSSYLNLPAEKAAARMLELVKPNALASGIFPSVKAAQLILESNYLKSELAQNACNGFGMKKSLSGNTWPGSVWDGASVYTKETKEQKPDGAVYTAVADFRKYPSIADSIADHSAYLLGAKNGNALRYAGLTSAPNYKEQITLIKNGGYATDANYITKVCGIIEKFGLDKYDDEVGIEGLLNKLEEKTTLDRAYWRRVLTGEIPATSGYLFVLLERLAG